MVQLLSARLRLTSSSPDARWDSFLNFLHWPSLHRLKDLALKGTLDLTNSVRRLEDFNKVFPRGKTPLAGQLP